MELERPQTPLRRPSPRWRASDARRGALALALVAAGLASPALTAAPAGPPAPSQADPAPGTDPSVADASPALAAARRHLAAGDRAAALAMLEPLVATDAAVPPEARRLLAAVYLDLGRAADAARVLAPLAAPGAASGAAGEDAEALFLAARAALALGRLDQAEELLARSAARSPVSFAAVLLADLRTQQERHEEAAALLAPVAGALDQVAGSDPLLGAQIALHYGRTLLALERRDEAVAELRRAARLAPASADAWRLLGETLVEAGELDEARQALTRAQELDQAAHAGEVAAARAEGEVAELVEAAGEHRAAGRPEEALAALRRASEVDPAALAPRLLEVRLLLSLDRGAAAAARGDELVELAPDHPDARHLRGMARLAAGDAAGAEADLRRALALSPDHLGAGNGLALALVALGRRDEAAAVVERVLERWPDDPLARRTRDRLRTPAAP